MKTIVIYKTVSGFTEKYARWIAETLQADIIKQSEATGKKLDEYDTIIYGGSLHAVGIIGLKKIKKLVSKLDNKNLVVFAVGASPEKEEVLAGIQKHNFDKCDEAKVFYLRGGFDFGKLDWLNKFLMFVFISIIRRKKDKTEDEKGMISAYEQPVDFTSRENIKGIVEYVKGL